MLFLIIYVALAKIRGKNHKFYINFTKNKFLLQLFNLTFVSIYQNVVILLFTIPAWQTDPVWKESDCYVALLWMFLFGMEVTADQ